MAAQQHPDYVKRAKQAPLRSTWESRQRPADELVNQQDARKHERRRVEREAYSNS